jgi:putative ABC transport system ATP-binding protein
MIKLSNIHVIFNQGTQLENHVLKGLDLSISEGEFVTIIGGNGEGKSTLMNILAGDTLALKGEIFIDNQRITRWPTQKRAKMVARIFQDPIMGTYSDLTIAENLSLAYKRGEYRGLRLSLKSTLIKKFQQVVSGLQLGLEDRLQDKVANLSGGQRQALSLVMATLQESKILLLDEHTAALDPKIASKIMELTNEIIYQKKLTTLMITHSMQQAISYGTRTIMLHQGKIAKNIVGNQRQSLTAEDLLAYFN